MKTKVDRVESGTVVMGWTARVGLAGAKVGLRVATGSNNSRAKENTMDELQIFAVGNKMDLQHLRKVTEHSHAVFIEENSLTGGFFTSAQSGDNVTASFYDAAAKRMGIKLSDHELAFHRKALAVTVTRGGDDGARAPGADAIEAEDLAHGETWQDIEFASRTRRGQPMSPPTSKKTGNLAEIARKPLK